MNDFEDRLTSALRSAGDDAPGASGLAPAARGRARARRRRTALTSVAAVVAVGGVIGGAALLGNRDGASTVSPSTGGTEATSSPDTPVANTRVESWRDVSVLVPVGYGYGNLSTWCTNGKREPGVPVVERPGGVVETIACPYSGYGVSFGDANAFDPAEPPGKLWQYGPVDSSVTQSFPDGAWLGYQITSDGQTVVQVSLPSRAEAQAVLDSFVQNSGADANGCPANGRDTGPAVGEGSLRVCRYGLDDWLEQSELMTGQDAAHAVAALESAPPRDPDRMCTMELSGPTILMTTADAEGTVTLNACQGFTWDGVAQELTEGVLFWALSPGWSGGVEGDVPMPDKLRG